MIAFNVVAVSRLPRLAPRKPAGIAAPPPAQQAYIRAASAATRAAEAIATIDRALLTTISPRTIERRSAAIETLDVDQATRIITTICVPYEQAADVVLRGQMWSEVFARGSFVGIGMRANTIRVNRDHDRTRTIGKVIRFDPDDPRGLVAEIRIARTRLGDETLALAADDCLSASVGFSVPAGGAQHDYQRRARRIDRAVLDHVSLVESPAYAGATVLAVG